MDKKLLDILNKNGNKSDLEGLLSNYKKIFNLEHIQHKEKVSPEFLTYCQKGNFFVEVIVYDSKRKIFIQRDLTRNKRAWELVGGWIKLGESFEDALDRVITKETGSILIEAIPVGVIKNTYYTDIDTTTHTGILYIGRIGDDKAVLSNGMFTKSPEKYLNNKDKKIVKIGQKILVSKILQPPLNEVSFYSKSKAGHLFHKTIIKPISYFGSSFIIREKILEKINNQDKSVLDVASGDDLALLKIQQEGKLIIANDISRKSLKKISAKDKSKNIIYSNQNMLEMKFGKNFDVAIIKNVMHHLKSPEEIDYFLNNLKSIAKKFILIDIIDPKLNLLARLWNKYYKLMLDDQGDYFLNYEQFRKIINLYFPNYKLEFSKIRTIKGPYMMAVIKQ